MDAALNEQTNHNSDKTSTSPEMRTCQVLEQATWMDAALNGQPNHHSEETSTSLEMRTCRGS